MKSILYAIALSVTLSGCQVLTDRDNKLAASTILGAGTGILMASQIYGSGSGGAIAMVFGVQSYFIVLKSQDNRGFPVWRGLGMCRWWRHSRSAGNP